MEPKPKYVVNQDFEDYVEDWVTSDAKELTRMLARAERYIDRLGSGNPIQQADPIQSIGINFTTPPTGGSFTVAWVWNGTKYTSAAIAWNATYAGVATAINAARSAGGVLLPGPVQTYEGPMTPYVPSGPLPFTPVVVAFVARDGAQELATGTVVANNLTGGSGVEVAVTQICPGAPWGGRFNPSHLLAYNQLQSLKNAVCAQAEYMFNQGPRFFVEAQYKEVRGPEFTTRGRLPTIAPKARDEMGLAGLIVSSARSRQYSVDR
jgi:hypothetical protein